MTDFLVLINNPGTYALIAIAITALLGYMLKQVRITKEKNQSLEQSIQALINQQNDQFKFTLDAMTRQLGQVSTDVNKQIDLSFGKSDKVFQSIISQLTKLDLSQKSLTALTEDVVSLHHLFNDKRARGAFGESRLEHIIANILPSEYYTQQATLTNGRRVDCLIHLPGNGGDLPIDVKFPLENYEKAIADDNSEQQFHWHAFHQDLKKHIDDIANRYICPPQTTAYAVMYLPAESLFYESLKRFPELMSYAQKKCVCISSPSTLMSLIYASRTMIKDHQTHQHVQQITHLLTELGKDFSRFDARLDKYFAHIQRASHDADQVGLSAKKIIKRFAQLESAELEQISTD